jgi:aryl-phospho-beta-D-glucosidase BglC (GH1 family)
LRKLTKRYKDNPRVIGMDLRNEVRKSDMGTPTWGDGSVTDWKKAA